MDTEPNPIGYTADSRDRRIAALHPPLHQPPDFFHSPAIDSQVAVADPGGGPKMDGLAPLIEHKFDVIDESKQPAGERKMQI
jgi:hypothetical protein